MSTQTKFIDEFITGLNRSENNNNLVEMKASNIVVHLKARIEKYEKAGLLVFNEKEKPSSESSPFEQGKIYYLDYGSNTQIIGRYKESDVCNHYFYDLLHYWNGHESFRSGNEYCVKSGIETIRRASKAEIHHLVKHEIDNGCI